jgi:hypothetical protein
MITIRDQGSSQLIRPEDTASGLVMVQSAEEPVAKGDRSQGGFFNLQNLRGSRRRFVEPGAEDRYMPPCEAHGIWQEPDDW